MERLFKSAKAQRFELFISPHYFYPTDKGWKFDGPLETDEATSGLFARKGVLNLEGFAGSGADGWSVSSRTSKTARLSSSRRIASLGQRPTTLSCSSANAGLAGASSEAC
jgi:hypothetical protein